MSISDTTQQLNGATAVQYPAESGHWYDKNTGQQVELPPRTWAKTAIKRGLVPGVTSITRLVARGALERWKINRAILAAKQLVLDNSFEDELACTDEYLIADVWQLLDAESEAITGRGKELHAAIEQFAQNQNIDPKWMDHVTAVARAMNDLGIQLPYGSSEHSFATERYGGKVDWHNDTWLLDFKTKDRLGAPQGGVKKLAYPEHAQQLAAYEHGLDNNRLTEGLPERDPLRCANVFVGVEDAAVHVHEWSTHDLDRGYRKFEHLLNYWWEDKQS